MRIKIKIPELSRDAFFDGVDQLAHCAVQIELLEARKKHLINAIEKRYGDKVKELKASMKLLEGPLVSFATRHADELFSEGKKSADSPAAVFGFRMDPPSLATLKGSFEEVALALKEKGEDDFVKVVISLLKDAVMAAANKIEDPAERAQWLAERGLCFEQAEKFFIKPKAGADPKVS